MKQFDEKAEKTAWIGIGISVFFVLFVLWYVNGVLGLTEIFIMILTLLSTIAILYLVKWYANRNE